MIQLNQLCTMQVFLWLELGGHREHHTTYYCYLFISKFGFKIDWAVLYSLKWDHNSWWHTQRETLHKRRSQKWFNGTLSVTIWIRECPPSSNPQICKMMEENVRIMLRYSISQFRFAEWIRLWRTQKCTNRRLLLINVWSYLQDDGTKTFKDSHRYSIHYALILIYIVQSCIS